VSRKVYAIDMLGFGRSSAYAFPDDPEQIGWSFVSITVFYILLLKALFDDSTLNIAPRAIWTPMNSS
jgi:pimeloyl-ACP methyl ester carboxylesterase